MQFNIFKMIRKDSRGFTLIEVIVSLVVAGILGTMLVAFMGTSVMKSANPVIIAKDGAYLNSIMENIGADYRSLMVTSATPLTTLKDHLTNNKSLYGSNFTVATKRFNFPTGTGSVTEPTTESSSGKILKVTVTYNSLSLTSLFAE